MHRNYLLKLLEKYQPISEQEAYIKFAFLDFISQELNCFERANEAGHVTASAWLLNRDLSQVLLLHHAKFDKWCQLGGHCDGDPDVLRVAIKEAQEESGISNIIPINSDIFDLDIHSIPAMFNDKPHLHYDVRFLLKVNSDEPVLGNSESKAISWFGKDQQLLPTKAESILKMFRKWINASYVATP